MIGTSLGHYKIIEQLGAGGMGEVYRAHDPRLERDVAIKVLPDDFANDPDRLARFEREAKLLASLNHSNIAAIYGLEDEGEQRFIAMELVEGETLAERISRAGRVDVDEALDIARQIAEALEAAHENGVIHRDLKPANVVVTPDGKAKVLDFGLAKAYEVDASSSNVSPDLSHSPTMMEATRAGLIMGTAAYMSPEQARGKPVDKRADIWAFGCVVYEMLCGKTAFEGETVSDTMAAILKEEPDWERLPPDIPQRLENLAKRCLEKDERQRLRDIGDARLAMRGAFETSHLNESHARAADLRPWQRPRPAAAGVGALVVLASLVTWSFIQFENGAMVGDGLGSEKVRRLNVTLPDSAPLVYVGEATGGVGQTALGLSPDGNHLVYVGPAVSGSTTQLYLRPVRDGSTIPLPGTEGAYGPFFSPNGEWIGYFSGQQLMRVSVDGERVLPVAETNWAFQGSWSEDDRIAVVTSDGTRVGLVSPTGGELTFLEIESERVYPYVAQPRWIPNSEWLLLTCDGPQHLCVISTRTGEMRHLVAGGEAVFNVGASELLVGTDARYFEPGYLVYSAQQDNILMGVRFDPTRLQVIGEPVVLLQGVRRENIHGALQFMAASNGDAVFAAGSNSVLSRFVWADPSGSVDLLDFPARTYGPFHLSSDGRHVVVKHYPRVGQEEILFLDLETGDEIRWVDEDLGDSRELWPGPWIPGTTRAAVTAVGPTDVIVLEIDRTRPSGGTVLWSGAVQPWPEAIATDGRMLLSVGSPAILSLVDADNLSRLSSDPASELAPLVEGVGRQVLADLSPDMKWLAYTTDFSGPYEVWAVPIPPNRAPIRVSDPVGELPRWSPRGDGLYYRDGQRWYWVALTGSDEEPFATPQFVLEGDYLNVGGPEFDVSQDGSRLLLLLGPGERTQSTLSFITNWRAEIMRLLPMDQ